MGRTSFLVRSCHATSVASILDLMLHETAAILVMTAQVVLQTPLKPTAPGTPGDPTWQGILRMRDGRTFVTDGGLAMDAALVKPATLPDRELPAKVLEDYLGAPHKDECGLKDLNAAASGLTFTTPSGIALNATYINYLRRIVPAGSVRFRMTGKMQPVVIVDDGRVIGVLMPVAQ
jgi:hypothetical protein